MTWNIESEYPAIQSPPFETDYDFIKKNMQILEGQIQDLNLPHFNAINMEAHDTQLLASKIQNVFLLLEKTNIVFGNLSTFLVCLLSVDARDATAKKKRSELEQLAARKQQIEMPLQLFIKHCSQDFFELLLDHPQISPYRFLWEQSRMTAKNMLSENEESLIAALQTDGHQSWSNLYQAITGKGKLEVQVHGKTEIIGVAQALAIKSSKDEPTRRSAWLALQGFWTEHSESAAAILNSIAGWRHQMNEKRSQRRGQPLHFLDSALQFNRISRPTLDAMIHACNKNKFYLQKILPALAKQLGKTKLDSWDVYAPYPHSPKTQIKSFEDSFAQVQKCFESMDPQMGQFARMAYDNHWIEARLLPSKTGGAFCTQFMKSREPRVFLSYSGSVQDQITLAHELGHAFHGWVMRDLPYAQKHYPSTLAETASVFAETAVRENMLNSADRDEFMWNQAESILSYLINIPARFEFEKSFYERRLQSALSAEELSDLMEATLSEWYGPHFNQHDRLLWASKLHFSMTRNAFYNFPYTFGYLFSLSIYARRQSLGSDFMKTYIAILQDTGRMTAEDLIAKHLGEDIRQPQFWQKAFDVVRGQIDVFLSSSQN